MHYTYVVHGYKTHGNAVLDDLVRRSVLKTREGDTRIGLIQCAPQLEMSYILDGCIGMGLWATPYVIGVNARRTETVYAH